MTDTFVTPRRLDSRMYLPFNLPQARLDPDTAQPIAFVSLKLGQKLRLAWLNLHLVRLVGNSFTAPTKVNPSLAASYAGLYGGRANYILEPTGQPMSYTACDIPGASLFNPVFFEDVSSPDVYSVIVVNNFRDAQIDVCVSGSFMVEAF